MQREKSDQEFHSMHEIERIIGSKVVKNEKTSRRYYKVLWSSWELEDNLRKSCGALIEEFERTNSTEYTQLKDSKVEGRNSEETNNEAGSASLGTFLMAKTNVTLTSSSMDVAESSDKSNSSNYGSELDVPKDALPQLSENNKEQDDDQPGRKTKNEDKEEKIEASTIIVQIQEMKRESRDEKQVTGRKYKRKTKPISVCKGCGVTFNTSFYKEKCRFCTNTCKKCGKSFKRPSALRNHMEGVHEKNRNHQCDLCGKSFTTRHYLTNHILKHNEERKHACDTCDKKFKDITKLKRHKLIHTGVKPYKCDICQRDFQQNEALKKHMLLHSDGPRRFQCLLCKKGFNHKVSLKSHMLKHHDKNEQQAAVMIGLWKKYQQNETSSTTPILNEQNDVLAKALNDVVMVPQDSSHALPVDTDMNVSLPLFNFGNGLPGP